HRQKQKKLIMLPSETMIWQPEFTDKTLSRKPGAVQSNPPDSGKQSLHRIIARLWRKQHDTGTGTVFSGSTGYVVFFDSSVSAHCYLQCGWRCECTGCAA
ncbi:TPA: hypothetical protein ACIADN_005364, partial [Escherichia coli]